MAAGRLDDAERLVADCLALARRIGAFVDPTAFFGGAGNVVLIERGRWERGVALLESLLEQKPGMTAHRAALAMFQARLGHTDEARRQLQRFTDDDFATLPGAVLSGAGMVMLADTATWLRDTGAAARIRELLEPVSGRTAWNAFTALWPNDIALAQLSVVLGDHAAAHAYLDAAEELCEREDLVAHRVRVALYRAWALREAGETADASTAVADADASPCPGVAREARLMGLTA